MRPLTLLTLSTFCATAAAETPKAAEATVAPAKALVVTIDGKAMASGKVYENGDAASK